ncbi:hypothetical protein Tco_1004533 [Tanacetum coccineum]|uniref:Uncharacterized protein n=1 Tax=Tanacetum coccineum TaxID=301880 RepID=A0ABQ5FCB9_9ASTR
MEISIAVSDCLDDALVAPADRLKIGKCNASLKFGFTSKEATFKWSMMCKSSLPVYRGIPNSETFFKFALRSRYIMKITDGLMSINASTLEILCCYHPTNVSSGKPSYERLRHSQAQSCGVLQIRRMLIMHIFCGRTSFSRLRTKNISRVLAMYYPRFTKLVVNFVMDKDPSIPRRNKVNWHYARDDPMFTTINVISRNEEHSYCTGLILPEQSSKDKRKQRRKAIQIQSLKQKPPTAPKKKESLKMKAEDYRRMISLGNKVDDDQDDEASLKMDEDVDKNLRPSSMMNDEQSDEDEKAQDDVEERD